MTKQDKIDFKDPVVQNLFLLYQNKKFRHDIEILVNNNKSDIEKIRNDRKITKFIAGEYKSEKLDLEIQKVVLNIPLAYGEGLTMTKAFVTFTVFGIEPLKVLLMLDVKENVLLKTPLSINIESNSEGTKLEILLSNYHSRSDLNRFIKTEWKNIEKSRTKWNLSKMKLHKLKALSLNRDWKIYSEHLKRSHFKVVNKLKLKDVSSSTMVVSRINRRIKSFYP